MTPRSVYREAKDPNTSPQRLAELARQRGLVLRRRLAQNPAAPSKALEEILYPKDLIVWRALAQNPSSTAKVLSAVAREFPEEVLENPTLPLCSLEDPSFYQRGDTLRLLLRAKSAPPAMLEAAAENLRDARLRFAAAQHVATPPHCLARLALDLVVEVRRAAQENPSTPKETLALLQRAKSAALSEDEFSRLYQEKHLRLLLAQNPNTPERWIWHMFQHESLLIKSAILQRPKLPQELLKTPIERAPLRLAELFAKHPQIPEDILEKLLLHTNGTQGVSIYTGLSERPNLSEAILTHLIAGRRFRTALLTQPNLTGAHLKSLLKTFASQAPIRKILAQHPKAPQELLALCRRGGFDLATGTYTQPAPQISADDEAALLSMGELGTKIVARNPNTREEVLRSLIGFQGVGRIQYVQEGLAQNPGLKIELLEELSREPLNIRHVFRSPNAPPALLFRIWGEVSPFNTYAGSVKPTKPEEVFDCLSKAHYTEGRCIAARNVHLPEALRDKLVYDRFFEVREAIAARLDLAPWQLKKLSQDYHAEVRVVASYNPNAPQSFLSLLRRCGASEDLTAFAPPDLGLTAKELARLSRGGYFAKLLAARHPNAPADVLRRLALTDSTIGAYVMCHPNTSEDTLSSLAQRKHRSLQLALLKRSSLSQDILFLLMGGHDVLVRRQAAKHPDAAALRSLFSRAGASAELQGFSILDESLDPKTLSRFETGGLYAQHLAARHPNTSPAFLRSCLLSLRASLRELAAQTPSSPKALICQLQRLGASEDLTELEGPDEGVSEEEWSAARGLGPFGELLSDLMQPLEGG